MFAALATLFAGLGAAAASPVDRLVSAFLAGDRLELARSGWHLGAVGVEAELASPDRVRSMAALAAAPHAEDGWMLLDPLAAMAQGSDRPRAAAAARAAAAIARDLDRERALYLDVPLELLAAPLARWQQIAADPARWADVRVHALTTAQFLGPTIEPGNLGYDAAAHASDAEPEIRRAALELLPQPLSAEHLELASARARTEDDPDVAAVAGQVVCGGIAAGDKPGPILAALGAGGLARVRALLLEPPGTAPPAAMLDAALCAIAAGDADSRRALSRFRGQLDPEVRKLFDARRAWLE